MKIVGFLSETWLELKFSLLIFTIQPFHWKKIWNWNFLNFLFCYLGKFFVFRKLKKFFWSKLLCSIWNFLDLLKNFFLYFPLLHRIFHCLIPSNRWDPWIDVHSETHLFDFPMPSRPPVLCPKPQHRHWTDVPPVFMVILMSLVLFKHTPTPRGVSCWNGGSSGDTLQ